jgi:hypothetical protein
MLGRFNKTSGDGNNHILMLLEEFLGTLSEEQKLFTLLAIMMSF